MARAAEKYMEFSDKKATEDQAVILIKLINFNCLIIQLITQLCLENKTLRSLLHGFPAGPTTNSADKGKDKPAADLITNNEIANDA